MYCLMVKPLSGGYSLLNNEGSAEIVNGKATHEVGWLTDCNGVHPNSLGGIEVIDHGPFIWVAYKSV